MPANPINTWELQLAAGGAHRPSLDDIGGAAMVDDDAFPPPRDGSQPYADQMNQGQFQAFAHGRVVSPVRITIDFSAGSPFIDKLETASSLLAPSDFTVSRAGGGAAHGDLILDWLTWKIPPLVVEPVVSLNDVTVLTANQFSARIVTVGLPSGHSQIHIVSPVAGVPTDVRLTLHL